MSSPIPNHYALQKWKYATVKLQQAETESKRLLWTMIANGWKEIIYPAVVNTY